MKNIVYGSVAALAAWASPRSAAALAAAVAQASASTAAAGGGSGPSSTEQLFQALKKQDSQEVSRLLAAEPALASARRPDGVSAVLAALFAIKDETFLSPSSNPLLRDVLMYKPKLDGFEAAAVGDLAVVAAELRRDAAFARAFHPPPVGWTALHFAAFGGQVDVLELLLKGGADVDARAKTKFDNTPLQAAALTGQVEAIRRLIAHGADVRVKQAEGATALHEAAALGSEPLATLLLDAGADINAKAKDGSTPLDIAMKRSHTEVAALLRRRGAKVEEAELSEVRDARLPEESR